MFANLKADPYNFLLQNVTRLIVFPGSNSQSRVGWFEPRELIQSVDAGTCEFETQHAGSQPVHRRSLHHRRVQDMESLLKILNSDGIRQTPQRVSESIQLERIR